MNGGQSHERKDLTTTANCSVDAESATLTLAEIQRLAAEKRAIAEAVLAEALDFEKQLASESASVATLLAVVATAQAGEAEATERLNKAREDHAALIAAEKAARAEVNASLQRVRECSDARVEAEANVAEMRARIELLSGTNGLSAEAVKRIVERRIADRLRQTAEQTTG
jgi:phage shock protein A